MVLKLLCFLRWLRVGLTATKLARFIASIGELSQRARFAASTVDMASFYITRGLVGVEADHVG